MTEKIALFTGSFDPLTLGHMDIIRRASQLFDRLLVGVFYNPHKKSLLSLGEREEMLKHLTAELANVDIITSQEELVVTVAKQHGVTILVRGLRSSGDLDYEASFDFYNKNLAPDLETVYLLAQPQYRFVSSSGVRELLAFGADISPYVPQELVEKLEKLSGNKTDRN